MQSNVETNTAVKFLARLSKHDLKFVLIRIFNNRMLFLDEIETFHSVQRGINLPLENY